MELFAAAQAALVLFLAVALAVVVLVIRGVSAPRLGLLDLPAPAAH
jgi:hypothetical protein